MPVAITGYEIGLFVHVVAVVLAFGPTFGYAFFQAVTERNYPQGVPTMWRAIDATAGTWSRRPGTVALLAGLYLIIDGDSLGVLRRRSSVSGSSRSWSCSGSAAASSPRRGARRWSSPSGTSPPPAPARVEFSDEYWAVSKRIAQVGTLAGRPHRRDDLLHDRQALTAPHAQTSRSPCSTPAWAGSRCCTSAWSRCRRRTSSTSATTPTSPTGRRSSSEVRGRVEVASAYLLERGAKLLVLACNSATTAGLDVAREAAAAEAGVEVVAVIEPEAEIAAAITDSGRIGVLATPATVEGGAYHRALQAPGPRARGDRGRGAGPGADHPARQPDRRGGRLDRPLVLRAAPARRGRHGDPRLHPLPARAARCCSGSSAATSAS